MKLSNYLKDKIVIIIIVLVAYFIFLSFMIGFKVSHLFSITFTPLFFFILDYIFL